MVSAIRENPMGLLKSDFGPSAHVGVIALALRESRQLEGFCRPRPSGEEDGCGSVGTLRPWSSDDRESVLLLIPVGPPGVADFPGARSHFDFLRLLEDVAVVQVGIDVHKEAHTHSMWLEGVVQKRFHTNVGMQIG